MDKGARSRVACTRIRPSALAVAVSLGDVRYIAEHIVTLVAEEEQHGPKRVEVSDTFTADHVVQAYCAAAQMPRRHASVLWQGTALKPQR